MASSLLIASPVGPLELTADGPALTAIRFAGRDGDPDPAAAANAAPAEADVLRSAARQLAEYFAGVRTEFDLPLGAAGTDFQRSVRAALAAIPFGRRASYSQVAADVGRPQAARAVGAACRSNPLPIVVPCHRVVGADGSLTGYAGGTEIKTALLQLEERTLVSRGLAGEAGPGA